MRAIFGAAALSICACSGESTPASGASSSSSGAGGHEGPSHVEVRFEYAAGTVPRFLDVPWPSDAYVDADGTLVDAIPGLDAYATQNADKLEAALAPLRGFGVDTGAVFRLVDAGAKGGAIVDADAIDVSSLPANEAASIADDASVLLVDLDAPDAMHARVPARVAWHDDRPSGATTPPVLSVMPARGVVLAPGHEHCAVVTTRVTSKGAPIAASAAFAALASKGSDPIYGAAIDKLASLMPSLDRADIAGLAVFTTMNAADELADMRGQILALGPPALSWSASDLAPMGAGLFADHVVAGYSATFSDWLGQPGTLPDGSQDPARDQSTGAAYDALAAMGTAVFDAPNFLTQSPQGYDDPTHANVARDASGAPIVDPDHPTSKIWVTIALPKGTVPPDGFPIVILQHGLNGDRSFILTLANTLAKAGYATVAIDAPTFGARATDPSMVVDAKSNFPWSAGAPYGGPDGFVDVDASAVSLFGNFVDLGALRDQVRQGVLDLGTLADVVSDPALDLGPLLDAVPGAKLDASRLGYVGDSYGSILGLMVASVDPKIGHFVLNVGGGGVLTEIVANSPNLAELFSAASLVYGFTADRYDESHPLVQLIQATFDPADPLAHAGFLLGTPRVVAGSPIPRKDVVLIEAVWDEIVANEGTEAVARAAGLPLAAPNVGSNAGLTFATAAPDASGAIHDVPTAGVTALWLQASPASHGSDLYDAHGQRVFSPPFGRATSPAFPRLASSFSIREPYLGLQAMAVAFFTTAFAGDGAPSVTGFPTPRRDFDDDGVDDDQDAAPQDPTRH